MKSILKVLSVLFLSSIVTAQVLSVPHGGTGSTTLTQHGLLVGNGTGPVTAISPGTAGQCLISGGPNVDPVFAACPSGPGGGITALTGDVTASGTGTVFTTLANTAVTPGSYTNTNLTVDNKGRITAATNGTAGGGGGVNVFGTEVSDPHFAMKNVLGTDWYNASNDLSRKLLRNNYLPCFVAYGNSAVAPSGGGGQQVNFPTSWASFVYQDIGGNEQTQNKGNAGWTIQKTAGFAVIQSAINFLPATGQNCMFDLTVGGSDSVIAAYQQDAGGAYSSIYKRSMWAAVTWILTPQVLKVFAQNATKCTWGGAWSNDDAIKANTTVNPTFQGGLAKQVTTPTSETGSCTVTVASNGVLYLLYRASDSNFTLGPNAGTFTVKDGATLLTDTITNSSTLHNAGGALMAPAGVSTASVDQEGVFLARFTGLAPGEHNITFTPTSTTGKVSIAALYTPYLNGDGPTLAVSGVYRWCDPPQCSATPDPINPNTSKATTATFDDINRQVCSDARIDGLDCRFMDWRNLLNTTTDMFDYAHANSWTDNYETGRNCELGNPTAPGTNPATRNGCGRWKQYLMFKETMGYTTLNWKSYDMLSAGNRLQPTVAMWGDNTANQLDVGSTRTAFDKTGVVAAGAFQAYAAPSPGTLKVTMNGNGINLASGTNLTLAGLSGVSCLGTDASGNVGAGTCAGGPGGGNVSSTSTPTAPAPHMVPIWQSGTSISGLTIGAANTVLTSNGPSADPSWQSVPGGTAPAYAGVFQNVFMQGTVGGITLTGTGCSGAICTMVTPSADTSYRLTGTVTQVAPGAGCSTNGNLQLWLTYTDADSETSMVNIVVATLGMGQLANSANMTMGNGVNSGQNVFNLLPYIIRVKQTTSATFSLRQNAATVGCDPQPKFTMRLYLHAY